MFAGVGLHDSNSGDGFHHDAGDAGGEFLFDPARFSHFAPEENDGQHADGESDEAEAHEDGILEGEKDQRGEEGGGSANEVACEGDGSGATKGRHAEDGVDELGGAFRIEEAEGAVEEALEDLFSQVEGESLGDPIELVVRGEIEGTADAHEQRNDQTDGGDPAQGLPFAFG